ncbi:MAG TPA: WYL domain-containing protein, partial [Ktedonobacteraceae bacterium]
EQTVIFESSMLHSAPSSLVVTILSSAVQSMHSVRLSYRSVRAHETERVFDPYGVVYHEGFWYTIGYCHLRQGQRLFRLDRILQATILNEMFSLPSDFQALAAVQQALASVPRAWQIEVWLGTTLEEIQRQTHLANAYFTEVDGGVLLRGDVADLPWAARFLAGLGVTLVIHHPPELRAVLHQYALDLVDYAERTAHDDI